MTTPFTDPNQTAQPNSFAQYPQYSGGVNLNTSTNLNQPLYSTGQANPNVVVVYANNANPNQERLREIDFQLENGFGCYRCWLWFCFILTVLSLIADLAEVGTPGLAQYLIAPMVANAFCIVVYYLGIHSLKTKSFEKCQQFKTGLVISLVIYCIAIIVAGIGGATEGIIGGIIEIVIIFVVYLTAGKVSILLAERKQLFESKV